MNIEYLWEFCTLVAQKNMSVAARRLNISQQSLSKHLAAMEKELGVRLFERTRGSQTLTLTAAGEYFSQQAMAILNLWNKIKIELKNQSGSRAKLLLDSSQKGPFIQLVARYQRISTEKNLPAITWAPAVNVDSLSRVAEKDVDIAFDPFSVNMENAKLLESVHLFYDPVILIAHEDDPLAQQASVAVEALKGIRLLVILRARNTIYGWVPHDICNTCGFSPKLESLPYESTEELLSERLNPGHYALIPLSIKRQLEPILPYARFVSVEDSFYDMRAYYNPSNPDPRVKQAVQLLAELSATE